jgi:hypothetical protein
MIYYLENWWKKCYFFFLLQSAFQSFNKKLQVVKRYQPLKSTESLRIICFLLLNMSTVSQLQFPRLNIYQSNCLHLCGLWHSFCLLVGKPFDLYSTEQSMVRLTFFLSHFQKLGSVLFSKWSDGMRIGWLKLLDFPAWILFKP